ncbi:MAG: type II secretion system F family protein [Syntrophomonadaceae bacterium]|jgi:type IV pilus assembly protein PilC
MVADDAGAVIAILLKQNYHILSLEEVEENERNLRFDLVRIKKRDLVLMTSQFETLLRAGLNILHSFQILQEQTPNSGLKKTIIQLQGDIEAGMPLWQAMAKHPKIFSRIYVSIVKAGETGGSLIETLGSLREHLEREQEISCRIRAASIYPAFVCIIAVIAVIFIITFVMPIFARMLTSAGLTLPLPTSILLAISRLLGDAWLPLLVSICLAIVLMPMVGKTAAGRMFYDYLYLRLPLVGPVTTRLVMSRFARSLGILVKSGIPVLQALEVAAQVVDNTVISRGIMSASVSINEGESIAGPLEKTGLFDSLVTNLIAVGEETGTLDDILLTMSNYLDREVMHQVDTLTAMIEPALIFLLALMVGGVIMATLLPVFQIMQSVGY